MLSRHGLTATHHETLNALERFMATHGYAPTVRELASELGLAGTSSAHARLRSLEAAGAITRGDGRARIVQIAPAARLRTTSS
ncbi:MAG: repressor LexA [Nitriliruptoraceae bacterium]|jgi:repressor LexA